MKGTPKYTPPPSNRGQNSDRGFNKEKADPTQPFNNPSFPNPSNQFPAQQPINFNEINPDTGQPYIRIWTPD